MAAGVRRLLSPGWTLCKLQVHGALSDAQRLLASVCTAAASGPTQHAARSSGRTFSSSSFFSSSTRASDPKEGSSSSCDAAGQHDSSILANTGCSIGADMQQQQQQQQPPPQQQRLPKAVHPNPLHGPKRTLVVAVSGGVDSAVAAMLAKQAGHDVAAVFMQNWDEGEETGNGNCSVERDRKDAAAVCAKLGIQLHEVDFVQQYWTEVFETFVSELSRGLTPNPDLPCNRHIKFGSLLDWANSQGADALVTGHYARLGRDGKGRRQLLRGVDVAKDQSYFLASVGAQQLEHCEFPLGTMTKHEVRALASASNLPPATKRSSAGICFIGRRPFSDFLEQYVPPSPGRYIDVDSGTVLGDCPNTLAVTHGQRAPIGGGPDRAYVAGKDVGSGTVWVARGKCHPALLVRSALLRPAHWVAGEPPEALANAAEGAAQQQGQQQQQQGQRGREPLGATAGAAAPGALACGYKARYRQPLGSCVVTQAPGVTSSGANGDSTHSASHAFQASSFCRLSEQDSAVGPGFLLARMDKPAWALTPQQAFALYDGDVCLGSALLALPGQSLLEERRQQQQGQQGQEQGQEVRQEGCPLAAARKAESFARKV